MRAWKPEDRAPLRHGPERFNENLALRLYRERNAAPTLPRQCRFAVRTSRPAPVEDSEHPEGMALYPQSRRQVVTALPVVPGAHVGARPPRRVLPTLAADHAEPAEYLDRSHAILRFLSAAATSLAAWPDQQLILLVEQTLCDLRRTLGDDIGRARSFLSLLAAVRPGLGDIPLHAGRARARRIPGTPDLRRRLRSCPSRRRARRVDLAPADARPPRDPRPGAGTLLTPSASSVPEPAFLHGEAELLRALVGLPGGPAEIVPAAPLGALCRRIAESHRQPGRIGTGRLGSLPGGTPRPCAVPELAMSFEPRDGPIRPGNVVGGALTRTPTSIPSVPRESHTQTFEIGGFLAMLGLQDPTAS